ncbi:chaperone DNAJ [Cryptosporidium canis]|uniref:Chaperone DNAJ n=1 Tax=Cryptosporidium canis TaxID=195482 RepID=A0ABQ8P7K7_9CRYT|nr:chaperone DNAJ [Cryptosporidium canis]KAJ1611693.1 chaperone DNAJ [Cryptosporidium canis]
MDSRFSEFYNAFRLLGVEVGSSLSEIKSSYRKLAKKIHPDKNRGEHEKSAHERFTKLRDSYVLLCNDAERRRFEEYFLAKCGSSLIRQNCEQRNKDKNLRYSNDYKSNRVIRKGNACQVELEPLRRESIGLINIYKDRIKTITSEGCMHNKEQIWMSKLKYINLDRAIDQFNMFEKIVISKLEHLTRVVN